MLPPLPLAGDVTVSKDFNLSLASVDLDSPESAPPVVISGGISRAVLRVCVRVCWAGATAAERARWSLYVIAREPNPLGGPISSSARTHCLHHARGDASGDHPVKRTVIFCLAVESRVSVCAPQGRSTKSWALYTRGTDAPPPNSP